MINTVKTSKKAEMYKEWLYLNEVEGMTGGEIAKKFKGYKGLEYSANYIYMKIREEKKKRQSGIKRSVAPKKKERVFEL